MYLPRPFPVLLCLLLAAVAQTVHANGLLNDPQPPLPERPRPCEPAGPHSPSCEADEYELWFPSAIQGGECPLNGIEGAPFVPAEVTCQHITQAPTRLNVECVPFGSEQVHCWVWPVGRELLAGTPPESLGPSTTLGVGYGWNFLSGLTGEPLQPLGASVLISCPNHGVSGGVLEVVLTSPVGLRASHTFYVDCPD